MRSILMIVILALCTIGCGTKDDGGADEQSTTQIEKESTNAATEKMTRKEWKRTRLTLHEGYDLVDNDTDLNKKQINFYYFTSHRIFLHFIHLLLLLHLS